MFLFVEPYGWFRILVEFQAKTFKEIKQVRAHNIQSLIGNAGGYVGVLLGWNFADLPNVLRNIRNTIRDKMSLLF